MPGLGGTSRHQPQLRGRSGLQQGPQVGSWPSAPRAGDRNPGLLSLVRVRGSRRSLAELGAPPPVALPNWSHHQAPGPCEDRAKAAGARAKDLVPNFTPWCRRAGGVLALLQPQHPLFLFFSFFFEVALYKEDKRIYRGGENMR